MRRTATHRTTGRSVDPDEAAAFMASRGYEPLEPYPGRDKPWRCRHVQCGREVSPRYGNIKSGWGGCGVCSGSRVEPHEAADLMRAAGLEPQEAYPGSSQPWRCIHLACGRLVVARYETVRRGGGGCARCAGKGPIDPVEATELMRSMGLEPLEPYPGTLKKWRCTHVRCGREVSPRYNDVQQGHSGCDYCTGRYVDPEEAITSMRELGWEALEPYPGNTKAKWRLRHVECGMESLKTYKNVRSGYGCWHCRRNCPLSCPCRRQSGAEPLRSRWASTSYRGELVREGRSSFGSPLIP